MVMLSFFFQFFAMFLGKGTTVQRVKCCLCAHLSIVDFTTWIAIRYSKARPGVYALHFRIPIILFYKPLKHISNSVTYVHVYYI